MFLYILFLLAAAINTVYTYSPNATANLTGSANNTSVGNSRCITENVPVSVTSNNIKLLLAQPDDQIVATQTVQELLQNNSDLFARVNGGLNTITGIFSIYGKLCIPLDSKAAEKVQTVQFLTHGDTLDNTYWEIAPGYSCIEAARSGRLRHLLLRPHRRRKIRPSGSQSSRPGTNSSRNRPRAHHPAPQLQDWPIIVQKRCRRRSFGWLYRYKWRNDQVSARL